MNAVRLFKSSLCPHSRLMTLESPAKFVPDKTFTFCGTPLFIAPEVILSEGTFRVEKGVNSFVPCADALSLF